MTYTYNPTEINTRSISRARFQLGDTMTEGGADTCFLCDEEITAVLSEYPGWKKCLYKLACAVCMKLSYEADWKDDGTQFDLSRRAERWIKLRDELKKEADLEDMTPESGAVNASLENPEDGGHYFYGGMLASPYVKPPYPFEGDTGC